MISLSVNGRAVNVAEGATLHEAVRAAGFHVPALCAHPGLPPSRGKEPADFVYRGGERVDLVRGGDGERFGGCRLCLVEILGSREFVTACDTPAKEGMVVRTDTPRIRDARQENLVPILANHPHACLTCALREGCDRIQCSMNVPVEERCCPELGRCELQRIADQVGIRVDTPRYVPHHLPRMEDEPPLLRDANLCVACMRCVRACLEALGIGALAFTYDGREFVVGTSVGPTLASSDCVFCGTCVDVCPAGALRLADAGPRATGPTPSVAAALRPPGAWLEFNEANVARVPETEGVFQLLDEREEVIRIAGTPNIRAALLEQLARNRKARRFAFEEDKMYTKRETELLQAHVLRWGRLPADDEAGELL